MRFLRITLPRDKKQFYIYPRNYEEEIAPNVQDHLYYDDGGQSMLLVALADGAGPAELPVRVEEVSEAIAKAISDTFDHALLRITDEAAVKRIQIMTALGRELSDDEEAALDPDNDQPGFQRKKRFFERVSG